MALAFEEMPWGTTNDDVMGGRSTSQCSAQRGGFEFSGSLSLENDGGFASVLGALDRPPGRFGAIRLTVSGDGRRYQVRLRESNDFGATAWRAFFRAAEKPATITIKRQDFQAVIRGRSVIGAEPLEKTEIRFLGFLLNDRQPGPFRLKVHRVEFLPEEALGGVRLITGASRGIGLALAAAQLESPAVETVICTHRVQSDMTGLEALREQHDNRIRLLSLDVTDSVSVGRFSSALSDWEGGIDLAIHAAGILHEDSIGPEKSLAQCDAATLARLFQVNSIGPLMVAQALLPGQPRKKRFVMAFLSAMVGSIGDNRLGGWYGYRASKAALNQFIRTLANECRISHPGASIIALHPGTTDTALSEPFQRHIDPDLLYTPTRTASRLLGVIDGIDKTDSGRFLNWDGSEIPW